MGRKIITREMLEAALARGMSNAETARFYGMHPSSIHAACERYGILLPYSKFAGVMPSQKGEKVRRLNLPDTRIKAWSCSPSAISRALSRIKSDV